MRRNWGRVWAEQLPVPRSGDREHYPAETEKPSVSQLTDFKKEEPKRAT